MRLVGWKTGHKRGDRFVEMGPQTCDDAFAGTKDRSTRPTDQPQACGVLWRRSPQQTLKVRHKLAMKTCDVGITLWRCQIEGANERSKVICAFAALTQCGRAQRQRQLVLGCTAKRLVGGSERL